MNRAIASSTRRSMAATPMRCAKGAIWVSTNATASGERDRVYSAMRRARQTWRSAGEDLGPGLREAVLQLDGMGDVGPTGVGGPADGEGELGDAELRHQGRAWPGEGEAGLSSGGDPGRCFVDGLGWVLLGPGDGGEELGGLSPVGFVLAIAGKDASTSRGSSRSPSESGVVLVMEPIQAPTTDSPRGQKPLSTRGFSRLSAAGAGRSRRNSDGFRRRSLALAPQPPGLGSLPGVRCLSHRAGSAARRTVWRSLASCRVCASAYGRFREPNQRGRPSAGRRWGEGSGPT